MPEWFFEQALLSQIRLYPCLYNSEDECFSDYAKKSELWDNIAEFCFAPVELCKSTWIHIHNTFHRYIRVKMRNELNNKPLPTAYKWEQELEFLIPFIQPIIDAGCGNDTESADDDDDNSEIVSRSFSNVSQGSGFSTKIGGTTIETLISQVELHPCLYNADHISYNDPRHIKDQVWDKIGDVCKTPGDVCKKTWKGLRDSFMRYRRSWVRSLSSKSNVSHPRRQYKYYNALQFLIPHYKSHEHNNDDGFSTLMTTNMGGKDSSAEEDVDDEEHDNDNQKEGHINESQSPVSTGKLEPSVIKILISQVELHPCLYDADNMSYNDTQVKDEVWNKIGIICNSSGEMCKRSWKSVRDAFQRYRRIYIESLNSKGGRSRPRRPYKYYSALKFLIPHNRNYDVYGHKFPDLEQQLSFATTAADYSTPEKNNYDDFSSLTKESEDKPTPSVMSVQKRKSLNNTEVIRKRKHYLEPQKNSKFTCRRDHSNNTETSELKTKSIDSFFLCMAETVKTLPYYLQVRVKMQVGNIVSQAEMESVYCNSENSCSQENGQCSKSTCQLPVLSSAKPVVGSGSPSPSHDTSSTCVSPSIPPETDILPIIKQDFDEDEYED